MTRVAKVGNVSKTDAYFGHRPREKGAAAENRTAGRGRLSVMLTGW
jgi:hypothetical protein